MAKRKQPSVKFRVTNPTAFYEIAPGELLPRGFEGTVDDPTLPYLVDLEVATEPGRIWCVSVRARARDESAPVTSEGLRKLPINRLLRLVSSLVANTIYKYPLGVARLVQQEPDAVGLAAAREEIMYATRARRRLDDAFLEEVAEVWRSAPDARARTKFVAEHFRTVRENARKWVRAAKARGLIHEEEQ